MFKEKRGKPSLGVRTCLGSRKQLHMLRGWTHILPHPMPHDALHLESHTCMQYHHHFFAGWHKTARLVSLPTCAGAKKTKHLALSRTTIGKDPHLGNSSSVWSVAATNNRRVCCLSRLERARERRGGFHVHTQARGRNFHRGERGTSNGKVSALLNSKWLGGALGSGAWGLGKTGSGSLLQE